MLLFVQTESTYAQEQKDSVLFTFIFLETGDVYVGNVTEKSDSALVLDEMNLGRIIIARKDVKETEDVLRNSSVRLLLANQSNYSGRLLNVEEGHYIISNEYAGVVEVPIIQVKEITILEDEQMVVHNPNSTRYFFAPSAIPLEKNGGYYQNAYLLANSVNFGLTRNFTLGGGVVIPLLFYITPKVGFEVSRNFYLGAGVLAATTLIPDAIMSGGIPFGVLTVGNTEDNVSLGAGYGLMWNEGDFQQSKYPIITLNGMKRISRRIQLVTENWIVPFEEETAGDFYYDPNGNLIQEPVSTSVDVTLALSLGMRVIVGDRSTVDFAPVYFYANEGIVIPYLDFVYKF